MKTGLPTALAAAALLAASPLAVGVTLPPLFGSHMVLQSGAPVPIWGEASPGQKVTVSISGQTAASTADAAGKWLVRLAPLASGGGPYTITVQGENRIELTDVLAGEVWLCSGQSNMELAVRRADHATEEIAAASHPSLRLFHAANRVANAPQSRLGGQWTVCSPTTVPNFSAVAYYYGRALHDKLHVPVGLVEISWSGTLIEAWMSRSALQSDPSFAPILTRFTELLAAYPAARAQYDRDLPRLQKEHDAAVAKAQAAGAGLPSSPLDVTRFYG